MLFMGIMKKRNKMWWWLFIFLEILLPTIFVGCWLFLGLFIISGLLFGCVKLLRLLFVLLVYGDSVQSCEIVLERRFGNVFNQR